MLVNICCFIYDLLLSALVSYQAENIEFYNLESQVLNLSVETFMHHNTRCQHVISGHIGLVLI